MRFLKNWLAPIIASLLVLALGGLYVSTLDSHGMLMWDEAHYATLGRGLVRGDGYTDHDGQPERLRPPLVPAAVAVAMLVAGRQSDVVAKSPILVFSVLCPLLLYLALLRTRGALTALFAAVTLALFPSYWGATAHLLTEIPFMLFYAAAVLAFHRGLTREPRWFLLAWPCFALALLTRYTAVLFGPTIVLLVVVHAAMSGTIVVRRLLTLPSLLGAFAAAAMLAPWFGYFWYHFGDPLIGFRQASGQIPAYGAHATFPVYYYLQILPGMLGWISAGMFVVGAAACVATGDALGLTCLAAVGIVLGWMSQYGWKEERLVTSCLPFVAVVAAVGAQKLASPWQGGRLRSQAAHALLGVVLLLVFLSSHRSATAMLKGSFTLGYPTFVTAMKDLGRIAPPDAIVLGANCYQIYWYSDRQCRGIFSKERLRETGQTFDQRLAMASWLVVTNFERGQPAHVMEEIRHLRVADDGPDGVRRYQDARYWTLLIPTELLRKRRPPE